ncbi:MAG TPA: hypothetical protein VGG91_11490 [Myxococcaceae bacterium]
MPRVEISDGGRAGTITYREGLDSTSFDWEFAMSPALAVITGPAGRDWDRACPWARGRQAEIFDHVAGEVIRQKASGCTPEIDLDAGTITLLEARRGATSRKPRGPLDPLGELAEGELEQLIGLILQDGISGPTVDALAQIDHPRARAAVDEAARDHLSVDARLAAAEALHARGTVAELEPVITRELRVLNRRSEGLARALRLAAAHPSPAVKQALLWASWNQTECSADCARLLVDIVGGKEAVAAMGPQLEGLGFHRSFFERKAAFDTLCQTLAMTLEPG